MKLVTKDVKDMFLNIPKDKFIELIKKNKVSNYQHKNQIVKTNIYGTKLFQIQQ